MRPLKVGIQIFGFEQTPAFPFATTPSWRDMVELAQRAEALGFDSIWMTDHLIYRLNDTDPLFGHWDGWSLLSALAATTSRLTIGTNVICTAFRNPALIAKMADTVDEICGGRLILGLGAGYFDPEFRAFGYPFDRRVARFEEALTIITSLLRTGSADLEGTFYSARECELRPRGPRPQGPPIMIGGTGPRILRLTAQYADLWNGWIAFSNSFPESAEPHMARVDEACLAAGRDPATLGRTITVQVQFPGQALVPGLGTPLSGDPRRLADSFRDFARTGVQHLQLVSAWSEDALESAAHALQILDSEAT